MRLFSFLKNPIVAAALAGIAGIVIGLVILGWGLWPVQWTDATPEALSQTYRVDYVRMTIDSFGINHDSKLALARWDSLGPQAASAYLAIESAPGKLDPTNILTFRNLIESQRGSMDALAQGNGQGTSSAGNSGGSSSLGGINRNYLFLGLGLLLVLGGIGAYLFGRRFLFNRQLTPEEYSPARQAQELNRAVEKTDFGKLGLQDPITRTMTTYVLGDDLYDESFSIDSAAGEFLGEYGVGISEAVGVGEPKKVTAIEIWLFDKNDIKTATKVLMSPHAFSDPNIRARLEAKGELVQLQPQAQIILETQTLQLLATIVDLEYGQGSMPDKSFFERITLELAVWPK